MAFEGVILGVSIDETHQIAKKILVCLIKKPTRVRDIWKSAVQDSAGVGKAIRIFYWLRNKGYIQKSGDRYQDPYIITDKGRAFLNAI